jgi:hypothetical protein
MTDSQGPEKQFIEMTPERIERMEEIANLALVFASDPLRMRLLAAKVMARAVTNDEVFRLLQRAAVEDFPELPL